MKKKVMYLSIIAVIISGLAFSIAQALKKEEPKETEMAKEESKEMEVVQTTKSEQMKKSNSDVSKDVLSMIRVVEEMEGGIRLAYTIENHSDQSVTFPFRNSQRYDYILRNKAGEVISRFSSDKVFMMSLGEETIQPKESLAYDLVIENLEPGNYIIEVWLTTTDEEPYEQTYEFEIQ